MARRGLPSNFLSDREPLYVAVAGSGGAGEAECRAAEEVGRELGRRGAVVVCGGLGGVMAAACRGAHAEGAVTVGILPGDDRAAANPWVDVAVATGMGEGRNALVVRTVDALVAVGGEYGTLSEIALALKLGKPVVGLGTWELGGAPGAAPAGRAIVRAADPVAAARTALDLIR
jgi:uncharacterized protein (TIGR00725 family)